MHVDDLKSGDVVVFSAVPTCSYLSVGKPYTIAVNKGEIYFRSLSGSGTFEPKRVLRHSYVSFRLLSRRED